MRSLVFLLPLLLCGFTYGTGGTGGACPTVRPGDTCFSDFTTTTTDAISIQQCREARVNFRSNIANAGDNDASVIIYTCPAGVTTVTAACGIAIGYRDANGVVQTALTGASGLDNIYGIVGQNLVASVTHGAGQTSRVQVDCR